MFNLYEIGENLENRVCLKEFVHDIVNDVNDYSLNDCFVICIDIQLKTRVTN